MNYLKKKNSIKEKQIYTKWENLKVSSTKGFEKQLNLGTCKQ